MTTTRAALLLLLFFVSTTSYSIDRIPVRGSSIVSAGYSDKNRILEVEFKNGQVVQYSRVLLSTYDKMMEADSPSKYFKENIKGRYEYVAVQKKKKAKKKKKKKKKKKSKNRK